MNQISSPSSSFITSIFFLLTFSIYFPLPGMQPQLGDSCNRNVFILTLTGLTCWYLQCSVSCGNGTQERQVMCSSPEVSVQNCTEPRPITTRNCQAPSCSGMQWPIWSCSGGCGLHVGDFCPPPCRWPEELHHSVAVQVQHRSPNLKHIFQ